MRLSDILPHEPILFEGGNIFKDVNGRPLTKDIMKVDIIPTIKILEKIVGFPLVNNILGSSGKKESSGDIDIAVDSTKIDKDELFLKLSNWARNQGFNPKDWVRKVGISVNFKMPIRGDSKNGFVQVDLMFHENPSWMKFSMHSAGDASNYSGAERNMIMSSIAKSQGLKYSWQKGLVKREDDSSISTDPDIIAKKLFGKNADATIFDSVENIQDAIKKNPVLLKKLQTLQTNLLSSTLDGIVKKPAQIKADKEEYNRIEKVLSGL
jgi:hypothetical protein